MDHSSITVQSHSFLPKQARHLIWSVFFLAKQRGVTLEYHFPWITDEIVTTCITISDTSNPKFEAIATLVIKQTFVNQIGFVGLIGLVCVDSRYRGRGYSSILMQHAIALGVKKSWCALLLWTNKPDVYVKLGFDVDSKDVFGSVARVASTPIAKSPEPRIATLTEFGVPAFATEVRRFSDGCDFLTVCSTHHESTLVDWSARTGRVIQLIDRVLPDSWKINAPQGSELISALKRNGYAVRLAQGSVRMVKRLRDISSHGIPHIGIIHRI